MVTVNTLKVGWKLFFKHFLFFNILFWSDLKGDSAKIMFSIGTKIYETNANGDSLRTLYDNSDQDLASFDYNSKTNIFYFADDKNNKVIIYLIFWKSRKI